MSWTCRVCLGKVEIENSKDQMCSSCKRDKQNSELKQENERLKNIWETDESVNAMFGKLRSRISVLEGALKECVKELKDFCEEAGPYRTPALNQAEQALEQKGE